MSQSSKVLFQSKPSAVTSTEVYTCPISTSCVFSSLVICNQGSAPDRVRLSVAIGGAVLDPSQYIVYDLPLQGNDTYVLTGGVSLTASDKVRVYSTNGTSCFQGFGLERS